MTAVTGNKHITSSSTSSSSASRDCKCEVVVVGAGVAGSSAVYHLSEAGVKDIVLVEQGSFAGEGTDGDRKSGTAVMNAAPTVKMMLQFYATTSKFFIGHHGREGARRYLYASRLGMKLQKKLAKEVALTSPQDQIKELGTFYIGYKEDEEELRQEYETLKSVGCTRIEWYTKEMLRDVKGVTDHFECAIYFPDDAIIDSSSYAKGLVRHAQDKGSARLFLNTKVVSVSEEERNGETGAVVQVESGALIRCKHVVVATGAFFDAPELRGLLRPCYSYLVHVPVDGSQDSCEYSSNFVTWGFSHDWCFTKGKVRGSGEDDFCAYKDPRTKERCENLIRWTWDTYGCDTTNMSIKDVPKQYGIYSETPDYAPLVGSINPNSNTVCYLLGCNAVGQTVLSYCSSLVPALLGYREFTEVEEDNLKLLSIQRFSLLFKV